MVNTKMNEEKFSSSKNCSREGSTSLLVVEQELIIFIILHLNEQMYASAERIMT